MLLRSSIIALALAASGTALAQAAPDASAPKAPAVKQAKADEAAKPAAPPAPWLVNCASLSGQMACEAIQSLSIQKTGQLLLKVSVRMPQGSKSGALMLHLPHGMFLPDGVTLAVDGGAAQKHAVQTCDQKGCYVGMPLSDTFLKAMQTGKLLSVSFKNLEKSDITIPISLNGFKEAYAKLM